MSLEERHKDIEIERITLTAEEVAQMLGMSKRFVYELAQRGELPCIRFGHKVLFSRAVIENLIEGGESGG